MGELGNDVSGPHPSGSLAEVVKELRSALRGPVLTPELAEYGEARKVWNAMFDERRPAAVLRCADESDVSRAIAILADVDAPLALRGGGHNIAGFGTCEGGFVLDFGSMRQAEVDPDARRIRVGGGATLHDLDTAGAEFKLSVPVGIVSPTGVAGLTLNGGVGWQTRRYGYACDNLRAARVVTASGEVVLASETENSDLLWGLRGGGGNFGAVTEFEFEAYHRDEVLVALAHFQPADGEGIASLLRAYRDWSEEASNDESAAIVIETGGEDFSDSLPDLIGKTVVTIVAVSLDLSDSARERLQQVERFHKPAFADTSLVRMVDLQHMGDASHTAQPGKQRYMKGEMMSELAEETILGIANCCTELPTATSVFEMQTLGGAMRDFDDMHAAIGMRDAAYLGGFEINGEPGEELGDAIQWAREAWQVLRPTSVGGTYLNFDGEADESRVLGSLDADRGAKHERLIEVKTAWDPGNRFRINHNIPVAEDLLSR